MTTKTLIRGATVVSMDPQIGDLTADVLVEDDKIVAVEPNISADAEVIDATDCIVIPGFVDTHRHTWEAAIRGCAPNATLDDYFVEVLDTFAPVYRAEDVHASNVAGSLECLNAGITTLVDWSHINNTPDHSDAAVTGTAGDWHPSAVCVRQRQSLAGRLLVQQLDRDSGRRRASGPGHLLQLRRRSAHYGVGHSW